MSAGKAAVRAALAETAAATNPAPTPIRVRLLIGAETIAFGVSPLSFTIRCEIVTAGDRFVVGPGETLLPDS